MMGAIESNLVLNLTTEVKPWLGITPSDISQDLILNLMVSAAKRLADDFCNNPFLDPDDEDQIAVLIPDSVKMGVLQLIEQFYQDRLRKQGAAGAGAVRARSEGDVSISYVTEGEETSFKPTDMNTWIRNLLTPYRLLPGG